MIINDYNTIVTHGDIAYVYLKNITGTQPIIIDTEDINKINICTWYGKRGKWDQYARGMINGKEIKMHRFIMNVTNPKIHIDHINGNTYDNRKSNLRVADNATNHMNQKCRCDNKTGYKGVSQHGNKFVARIGTAGKIHIGLFDTAEDAARAYDQKAKELFGEYAKLNFPEGEVK